MMSDEEIKESEERIQAQEREQEPRQEQDKPDFYKIPGENFDQLQMRIEKLAKRARKLGVPEPSIKIVGESKRTVHAEIECIPPCTTPGHKFERTYFHVVPVGEAPKLAGWKFIGTLEHEYDEEQKFVGTILRTVPGYTMPTEYRVKEAWCDHCKLKRFRKDTYIVVSETDGSTKQVGHQCVRDFLGGVSPEQLARQMQAIYLMLGALEEEQEYHGPRGESTWSQKDWFEFVGAITRRFGYMSRKAAEMANDRDGKSIEPTSSLAHTHMFPSVDLLRMEKEGKWERITPNEEDKKMAQTVMAWAQTEFVDKQGELSDYEHNVQVALLTGVCKNRTKGILASVFGSYIRKLEKEARDKVYQMQLLQRQAASNYVGEIKKRMELTVTIVKVFNTETQFGTMKIMKMADESGNELTWFSSTGNLQVGKKYVVKLTPTKHQEYKSVKQTVVNRVVVVREAA